MGVAQSRHKIPTIVVSLDALRTLYTFKEPVAQQYLKVAQQCGLQKPVDPAALEASFAKAYKHYNTNFPNYGKGKLDDGDGKAPEIWWSKLIDEAFRDVVDKSEIPTSLGASLFKHFSSGAAYKMYPDAKHFMETMRTLKGKYSSPFAPRIFTGVITNSDPRVNAVLQDLGFKVGITEQPDQLLPDGRRAQDGTLPVYNLRDRYDPANDVDFLATSYDADSEKPGHGIWEYSRGLLDAVESGRIVWDMFTPSSQVDDKGDIHPSSFWKVVDSGRQALKYQWRSRRGSPLLWIHIGDEYKKDYVGATGAGLKALHLAREDEGNKTISGVESVSSLEEASAIVSLMAQGFIDDISSQNSRDPPG